MENSAVNPELIRLARQSRGYTQKQLLGGGQHCSIQVFQVGSRQRGG